jgi:D-lactate dehydrogenase (cytochrome)
VAVPFSRLADIIEVSKKEMDDLGLFASILGHIGDGNFHESIIYNRQDKSERDKVETCVKNMVKRALEMEGTCTGEHSIGWGKKESLLWEVGQDTLGVMVSHPGQPEARCTWLTHSTESYQVGTGSEVDNVRLTDSRLRQPDKEFWLTEHL